MIDRPAFWKGLLTLIAYVLAAYIAFYLVFLTWEAIVEINHVLRSIP